MRRKKSFQIFEKVLVTDIGAEGNAVARVDNAVIFIPMLVPGDVVDIRAIKKKNSYFEGSVLRFHEYSADRIKPRCVHFGVCGGCKWQHLPYNLQLHYKEKQVRDTLSRIGKIPLPDIEQIIGSDEEYFYRNKLEYAFSDRRWLTREELISDIDYPREDALGFHIPGTFDKVLDISECHLQPEPSGAIRDAARNYARKDRMIFFNYREQTGFLRNLILRNNIEGDFMVIVVFFYDDKRRREGLLDYLISEFPGIKSLFYIINSKRNDSLADQEPVLYHGSDHITEKVGELKFRIGPLSFFQTNTRQISKLYQTAKEFAQLTGSETVYDLYTGAGTIACFIADSAKKVIGIEYIEDAVKDAFKNAGINNINNVSFYAGDIRSVLNEQFFSDNGRPDVIITDPPRAGMHKD
ncbi:MAG: 23S rRNA (uracil(1939)-C(5))-methyltransferase RlmD, partial [Bacteroidales bacterium]|nr:23S rRNA (uracil(1939)-C(5))-methyltransferase RlmD [Bacteroidales bacterium]